MSASILSGLSLYSTRTAIETADQCFTYAQLIKAIASAEPLLHDVRMAAIMMQNSPAWIVMDLACISAGIPLLPLPAFFSEKQLSHALLESGTDTVFTDQPERFNGHTTCVPIAGKTYYRVTIDHTAVSLPPGTAKITYTSGTTNEPKGVCLSQSAMETVAKSLLSVIPSRHSKRHVCLLPLAVLLENIAGVYVALLSGATVCLTETMLTRESIGTTINTCQATSCILVPELLRMLLSSDIPTPTLTYAAVGGARVSPELLRHASSRSIPVYEGYGLSESCSVVSVNTPEHFRPGSVGKLLPHMDITIGHDGEIYIRNPLFSGYIGSQLPLEKYYPTGDIGRMDKDGFLYIEGRKKNIYITSYGRNVSPEWIESLLSASPLITQAAVFGEGKAFSTAVIVSNNPQSIPHIIQSVNHQLPDYARIGAHVIATEPFSLSNNQLTGTGRPRRQVIYEYYAHTIESNYTPETI